jgi:hypothetical protein
MASLPTSLVRRHNHLNALSALGILPEKPAFPAVIDCPFCQQPSLYLFDDVVCDGVWAHCEGCRAHGDIITFGARIWNISLAEALTRFADQGMASRGEVDRISGEYLRAVNRLAEAEAFWAVAASQAWNHHDDVIACRQRELGLDSAVPACDDLLGVAHPDQVAEFCRAVGKATPPRMREHGPSLVLPYYDLPGRLTGMLLVQYNDEFMSRRTFVPITSHIKRKAEAGYYLLQTVLLPSPVALRNSYFVTDDPFWMLKVQTAQLKAGLNMLPMAASYGGPEATSTGRNWQSFSSTPRMFHAASYTPEVISQANAAKGYVCVAPPEAVERTATPSRTLTRLAQIRQRAQTWQQALEHVLANTNETAASAFVTKLTVDIDKLQHFFRTRKHNLSPDFCGRLLTQVETGLNIPTKVTQKRSVVIERIGCWWTHTNHQIVNAQIQIDKIVHAENGERLYVGTIRTGEKTLEFADTADRIERMGLLAYAAQHAAAEDILILYDRTWNARSCMLALRLHEPEIAHVSGRSGWNERTHQFCFKSYAIENDGSVTRFPYPQINRDVPDFPEPLPVAPLPIRHLLTPSYENAYLWTVFAAFTADLLAPVVGRPATMTALSGEGYAAAVALGASLSCPEIRSAGVSKHNASTAIRKAAEEAHWPLFAAHAFSDVTLCRSVLRVPAGPGFVRLDDHTAGLAPGYGWQWIRGTAPADLPDFSALRHVLPSYIQRTLQRRVQLVTQKESLTVAVLEDLAEWLKDIYGATFNLACASNRLVTSDRAHEALMEVVNFGIIAGKLDILPRPRRKDQAGNYLLRNKQHWWLNQRALERYCVSAGGIVPNWQAVKELFSRNGLLYGDQNVHNMPGLLINKDWCDRFWSDYTTDAREFG